MVFCGSSFPIYIWFFSLRITTAQWSPQQQCLAAFCQLCHCDFLDVNLCTLAQLLWPHELHWEKLMRAVAITGIKASMRFWGQFLYDRAGNSIPSADNWVLSYEGICLLSCTWDKLTHWNGKRRCGKWCERSCEPGAHVEGWTLCSELDLCRPRFGLCCGSSIKEFLGAFGYPGVPPGMWHVMEPVYYPGVICSIYHSNGCGRDARIRKRGMPGDCRSVIEFCQDSKPCPRFLTCKMGIRWLFTDFRLGLNLNLGLDQFGYQLGDGNCKSMQQEFCWAALFSAFLTECDNTAGKWTFWASNLAIMRCFPFPRAQFRVPSRLRALVLPHRVCKPADRFMLLCCFWFNDVLKIIWSALLARWSFCLCRRNNAICCMWW